MGVSWRKEWERQGKDGRIMDKNRSNKVKIVADAGCIRVGALWEMNVRERNGNVIKVHDE